ncbi:MAG: O-antigen ligase family protein [Candidatus Moranbacteria bacterium]|nr:O-antigen ligase family protein [Candidatus Moranbacteria bacterium]
MFHLFRMTVIGKALLICGALLFVVIICFRNLDLLPLGTGYFVLFSVLAIGGATYRPGWMFLLLVMALPLEAANLAPSGLGFDLRPYQLLETSLFLGLLIRFFSKRALPELPKFELPDALLLLIPIGSLPALMNAPSTASSFKLSLVLFSLYGLYVLGRIYMRSLDDIRKVLPFVLVSGAIVLCYALFQNIRFLSGFDPFQAMPGRPDGGFPEPDWLGAYLIFLGAVFFSIFTGVFRGRFPGSRSGYFPMFLIGGASFILLFMTLLMTVARSAWIGALVSGVVSVGLFAFMRRDARIVGAYAGSILVSFILAVALVALVPLTRFDLLGRATSTAGLQEITISCDTGSALPVELPERISDISELGSYGCRHIDLEDIGSEEADGNFVGTVLRSDPSIGIRKDIYGISMAEIGGHPALGIGWGSISQILGTDERGAGLNASDVFLEVWLGSGVLGIIGIVGFFAVVLARAARSFHSSGPGTRFPEGAFPIFVLSVVSGLIVFNLFNSGILLGFFWVLLAVAVSVADDSKNKQ